MIAGPPVSRLSLYQITYEVDLATCRARMLERVAELGAGRRRGGMELVASAAGVSRATLRLFFEGRRVSVESFVSIITRGLLLDVNAVAKVVEIAA
jgi:AcrR family transcriptional regulator